MLSNKLALKQVVTIDDFLGLFDRNFISNHQEILNLDFSLIPKYIFFGLSGYV